MKNKTCKLQVIPVKYYRENHWVAVKVGYVDKKESEKSSHLRNENLIPNFDRLLKTDHFKLAT